MVNFKDWSEEEVKEFLTYRENQEEEYCKNNRINSILLIGIGEFGREVVGKVPFNNNPISQFCIYDYDREYIIIQTIQENDYIIICNDSGDEKFNKITERVADLCKEANKKFMICHCCTLFAIWSTPEADRQFKQNRDNFVKKIKDKKYLINEIPYISTSVTYDKFDFEFNEKKYCTFLQTTPLVNEITSSIFANLLTISIDEIIKRRK